MNRLISFFLAFLLPALVIGAPEPTYPQVEKVLRPSKSSVVTDLDKAFVRGLIGSPAIATAAAVASPDWALWGDSLTTEVNGQQSYPNTLRLLIGRGNFEIRGVGGETSSQILTRFNAMPSLWTRPTIIWAGRNNWGNPTQVKADIASMVASLRVTQGPNAPFLVLAVTNGAAANERKGQADYNTLIQLDADLAATYGDRFVDVRAILVANFNPSIPQDVTDHTDDTTPSSLRTDGIHFTSAGFTLVANAVYARIQQLWPTSTGAITMDNAKALFTTPFDSTSPYRLSTLNYIVALSNKGGISQNSAKFTTSQNGDYFQISGSGILGDQQVTLGSSAAAFWWGGAYFKNTVRSPLFEAHPVSGANVAGNMLTIGGGPSNGSADGGGIAFATSPAGAAGSTQNARVNAVFIDADTTLGNTRFQLFDNVKGSLQKVKVGTADSAGTGKRALYLDN